MRIMPTLIAAALGALAVWGIILLLCLGAYLSFEYPYTMAVVAVTAGGASLGAVLYKEFTELDELYEEFTELDE